MYTYIYKVKTKSLYFEVCRNMAIAIAIAIATYIYIYLNY